MKEFTEKLISRLEEESDYEPIDYDYCDMSCSDEEHFISTHKAIQIVSQLAKEYVPDTNAGNKDGWIPVEERLPKDKQQVLVTNWDYSVLPARYDENEERFIGIRNGFTLPLILAWQPLPKPYREKGE